MDKKRAPQSHGIRRTAAVGGAFDQPETRHHPALEVTEEELLDWESVREREKGSGMLGIFAVFLPVGRQS